MTSPAIDILVVEDADAHAELIARVFEPERERYRIQIASDLAQARAALAERIPGLVIADSRLPDGCGIELAVPDGEYPLVLMTSHGDEASAVGAMKAGALDYVVKNVEVLLDLPHIAERALREWGHVLERRRAEAELRQRELELRHVQKLEAIGRLASGVAHDFNNVLMGIAGCAEAASRQLDDQHPARAYLDEVRSAAGRASSITARLLAFSRRGGLERSVLAIDALIGQAAMMARPLLPADIELVFDLAAGSALVDGDPGQLEQVLLNLVTNARDAMPGGGRLVVATRDLVMEGGRHVELTVADTGTGMDDATRARIFEPFFTTKEVGRGTGLGLATVYGIVRQHGGHVELESAPGAGTTFRIFLPCSGDTSPSAGAPQADVEARLEPGRARRILLVEDDLLVRATVRQYLTRAGHHVVEAADTVTALAHLEEHGRNLDLVVTDVVLPGGGGARVAAAAADTFGATLPVLFMSAHPADVLEAERRIPLGTSVLQKPFTESALIAAVRDAIPPAVLFIEDDRAARIAMVELLADAGFVVAAASRGDEAIRLFAERRTDVVVTDLGLPDMPGDDLAARLRTLAPALPILIVTGRAMTDPIVQRALAPPRTTAVTKPVDIDELVAAIRSLLHDSAAERRSA